LLTRFDPMSPVPPMMTSFMIEVLSVSSSDAAARSLMSLWVHR